MCQPGVALGAVLVARPSLRGSLLETRRIVGVENRPVSTFSSSVVWKCFKCGLPHILICIWQLMALSDHEFSLSGLENKRFYCIRMYFKLFG